MNPILINQKIYYFCIECTRNADIISQVWIFVFLIPNDQNVNKINR